jgi:hypothetical protein
MRSLWFYVCSSPCFSSEKARINATKLLASISDCVTPRSVSLMQCSRRSRRATASYSLQNIRHYSSRPTAQVRHRHVLGPRRPDKIGNNKTDRNIIRRFHLRHPQFTSALMNLPASCLVGTAYDDMELKFSSIPYREGLPIKVHSSVV